MSSRGRLIASINGAAARCSFFPAVVMGAIVNMIKVVLTRVGVA
jgi:xanthine/uracil permease